MRKEYKLIWFQHFHKAGGTSIVELAKKNNECLWHKNNNGNPLDDNGDVIKVWDYSETRLTEFIDECEAKGVTFVATEWGVPNIDVLQSDSRVVLLTCLRNPLKRYVSNFYFDLHNGFTPARNLFEYQATRNRTITMFDYYCRLLSGYQNQQGELSLVEYDQALSKLKKFDLCLLLEGGLSNLSDAPLNWKLEEVHKNQNSFSWKSIFKLFLKAKFKFAYYRLRYRKKTPDQEFSQHFSNNNVHDLALYDEAKKLANRI